MSKIRFAIVLSVIAAAPSLAPAQPASRDTVDQFVEILGQVVQDGHAFPRRRAASPTLTRRASGMNAFSLACAWG